MKISDILNNIDFIKVVNETDELVEYFLNDSREKVDNSLYFGIKGESFDGSKFYKDALINGCVCAIIEEFEIDEDYLLKNNKCVIIVKNSLKALESLAKYKRSINKIPIIAITGSAGKTSTKDLVHAALSKKYNVFKTPGNKNNEIGLPMTLLNLKNEDIAVLEMGMNHFKEISYLTNIVKPDIAIINNIGTAHIGNLGSKENILKAKLEILEGLNELSKVIINNDDELLNDWAKNNQNDYNILTYGLKNESNIIVTNVELESLSSSFIYKDEKIIVPIPGVQYVSNALAAILVAEIFKTSPKEIMEGIKNVELSSNRMDIKTNNGITIINDTYNANIDAVLYAVKNLGTFTGRKIACLGDMLELGDFSKEIHSSLGEKINKDDVDILITVGLLSEYTHKSALLKGINAIHFNSNTEAIDYINEIKKENDIYLVKASQGCKFIEIVDNIK